MKNHERWAQPYALATATSGSVSVAGISIGTSGSSSGPVVCVRTNGGALVAMGAPGTRTGQVPSTNSSATASASSSSSTESTADSSTT